MDLQQFVDDFALALGEVDAKRPQAISARDGAPYQPGIGPHTEPQTVKLVMGHLDAMSSSRYRGAHSLEVAYPTARRSKCDVCLGIGPEWQWAIEVKMLRLMGDNGKPNDNILMHILSPYPAHRSALTDTEKLLASGLLGRKAIIVFAYEYEDWPASLALNAFSILAAQRVSLRPAQVRRIEGLVHPVHRRASIHGWEVEAAAPR